MTGQTKTTKSQQPGPTRAPQKDQAEGAPEVVDKELNKAGAGGSGSSGVSKDKDGRSGGGKA